MDDSSILDKVLSSKQVADIENFSPSETLTALFKELTPKEEETLRRRFGLHEHPQETLEEIGKRFAVTRERVRQIEEAAIQKIKHSKRFHDSVRSTEELIHQLLETHGGAMTEERLMHELFRESVPHEADERALLFLLNELLSDRYDRIGRAQGVRPGWKLKGVSLTTLSEILDALHAAIDEMKSAHTLEKLYSLLQQRPFFAQHPERFTEEMLQSYLELHPRIGNNPYQEYGLVAWGAVAPKRMHDKIYLVLKKFGKPLHFTEITRLINETHFDRRTAYPPTVHNELILNPEYVLVGRGVYALKEWGYKPGVVADVIQDVLRSAGDALSRDEIVRRVLEQRVVKKNTIHLALADKNLFEKLPDGRYHLIARPETIPASPAAPLAPETPVSRPEDQNPPTP